MGLQIKQRSNDFYNGQDAELNAVKAEQAASNAKVQETNASNARIM